MPTYLFSELVEIDKLKVSMEYLYKITGLANAILDVDENVLVASGWSKLCTEFHRCHPVTLTRCKESDAYIKSHLHKADYAEYRCKNGLRDVAFPIEVDGQHIATFFFGQCFYADDPPDYEFFRKQARELGFDVDRYLDAVREVLIIPREKIEHIISYYQSIAALLIQIGMTQKKQLVINNELEMHRHHLEELVKKRTLELEEAKENAETANQAKSLFLANVSHELRTPLHSILGYSQFMQRDRTLNPNQLENLNIINQSGEHLMLLINDVLSLSKIEAGQMDVRNSVFNLRVLLDDLKNMFRASLNEKCLGFKIICIDDLPGYITADENKLKHVLVNLLSNAINFTQEGRIILRVTVKDRAERTRLSIQVEDTGVGIHENELGRVFRYFEQTASGRKRKSGTGLGLAISQEYVRMMGGEVSVKSREGNGSIFSFEIDITRENVRNIDELSGQPRYVAGLAPDQTIPRILVVEDMKESRMLLVKLLESVGFHVREAVNGKQCLELFEKWHPDFIWMDIRMPVMDGLEATRCIKETGVGKSTIVAALTAHALEEEKTRILAAGCDDFVGKPFREREIFEVMARHLGVKYTYEVEQLVEKAANTVPEIKSGQLAALPENLRNRLHQAVIELDMERTQLLIDKISEQDEAIGSVFSKLAKRLDYDSLLKLLEGEYY